MGFFFLIEISRLKFLVDLSSLMFSIFLACLLPAPFGCCFILVWTADVRTWNLEDGCCEFLLTFGGCQSSICSYIIGYGFCTFHISTLLDAWMAGCQLSTKT